MTKSYSKSTIICRNTHLVRNFQINAKNKLIAKCLSKHSPIYTRHDLEYDT